jgi:hypothetical protein
MLLSHTGRRTPFGSLRTIAPEIVRPLGEIPGAAVLRKELGDIVTSLAGASRTLNAKHGELALYIAKNILCDKLGRHRLEDDLALLGHRCHSIPASRLTAGAFGFFDLTQYSVRPET